MTRITGVLDKSGPLMAWAINNTIDVCKGAIAPGTEYAEVYLDAVFKSARSRSETLRNEAAQRGRKAHKEIEDHFVNLAKSGISDDEISVLSWAKTLHISEVERRVYSRRYRYSGTFDALAKDEEGKLILIDWKTSKSIYPEFRLQTAAYCRAYEEEFPSQKIEGRYLVRIAEDGTIEPHYYPRSTLRLDFAAFLGAQRLFNRVQQIEKEMKKTAKLLKTNERIM